MSLPLDLVRGDIPLGRTYWLFGVVPGGLLAVAQIYLERQRESIADPAGTALGMGLGLLAIAYYPLICVAIWRSATKYQGPRWLAVLAKVVVVLGVVRFLSEVMSFSSGTQPPAGQ